MAGDQDVDPRMMSVHPRIRYNTIGGVNGPLVILENVSMLNNAWRERSSSKQGAGQIPTLQRDRVSDPA